MEDWINLCNFIFEGKRLQKFFWFCPRVCQKVPCCHMEAKNPFLVFCSSLVCDQTKPCQIWARTRCITALHTDNFVSHTPWVRVLALELNVVTGLIELCDTLPAGISVQWALRDILADPTFLSCPVWGRREDRSGESGFVGSWLGTSGEQVGFCPVVGKWLFWFVNNQILLEPY